MSDARRIRQEIGPPNLARWRPAGSLGRRSSRSLHLGQVPGTLADGRFGGIWGRAAARAPRGGGWRGARVAGDVSGGAVGQSGRRGRVLGPLENRARARLLPAREAGGMFPEPSPSASEGEVRRECPLLPIRHGIARCMSEGAFRADFERVLGRPKAAPCSGRELSKSLRAAKPHSGFSKVPGP